MAAIARLFAALVVLGCAFALIERRVPRRSDLRTDLVFWFFTPLVSHGLTRLALGAAAALLALAMGFGAGREAMRAWLARPTWISAQPRWAQLVLAMLLGDLLGYVAHRLFHRGRAWRFHAVHHSSPGLDWLSSVRLHPLNEVGSRLLVVVPLALLGFKPLQVAAVPVATALYALLLHADVSWDFGPLRGVLASPAFHRWHHAAGPAARDRNFAGLFAFWDVLFGTYHLPRGARPERLGVDEAVPRGVLAQLVWPFVSGAWNGSDQPSKDDPHVPRARRSDAGSSPASAVR